MIPWTKQETWVLCIVTALLLLGMAVKVYRKQHAPVSVSVPAKP